MNRHRQSLRRLIARMGDGKTLTIRKNNAIPGLKGLTWDFVHAAPVLAGASEVVLESLSGGKRTRIRGEVFEGSEVEIQGVQHVIAADATASADNTLTLHLTEGLQGDIPKGAGAKVSGYVESPAYPALISSWSVQKLAIFDGAGFSAKIADDPPWELTPGMKVVVSDGRQGGIKDVGERPGGWALDVGTAS